MDFSKLLQHCRDEHGVNVDTSVLMKELVITIFRHFDRKHGLILHDTEIWDILETLQKRPNPSNPPPIVATMKQRAFENIECGEGMDDRRWDQQHGVLITNREALEIVKFCERANVPEQLPEPVIYPRPDWESIDTKFNYVAVDDDKDVYAFAEKPKFRGGLWQGGGEYEYLHGINFAKMIWQRPGHGEKEGAE